MSKRNNILGISLNADQYRSFVEKTNFEQFPSIQERIKYENTDEIVSPYVALYRRLVKQAKDLPKGAVFTVSTFCPAPPVILLRWFYSNVSEKYLKYFEILPKTSPQQETQYQRV